MHSEDDRAGAFTGLRWGAGLATAAASLFAVTMLSLAIGFLAKSLTRAVDEPFFARIERAGTNDWTDVLTTLTKMGNVSQTQKLTAVLAVGLALWFWRRGLRWWIPLVVLPMTWIVSRLFQFGIAKIVDRDRDAISLLGTNVGAFPSGGVMRIITVTGVAVFLAAYYLGWSRRAQVWGFVVVTVLGLAEAYFRARLNQHWITDVISGLIVGWLFVAAVAATVRAFDPVPALSRASRAPGGPASPAPRPSARRPAASG